MSNVFFAPILWVMLITVLGYGVYFMYTKKLSMGVSREFLGVVVASIVMAVTIAFFTTPTIFSGRDQGSYSATAIHLVENHKLAFSTPASTAFFTLHGPGKALNFPGFDYTTDGSLITQFPLGYIVWLASFFALFGLSGLIIANAITLALFLIAFYLLIKLFASRFYAVWGFVITAVSLPVVWFSKMTLSENLALTLFTLLALNLVLALKKQSTFFATIALALAGFFVFTRIEGIAFLCITIIILALSQKNRLLWKSKPIPYILLPALIFSILLVRNFFVNFPFYKTVAKAGLSKWHSFFEPCVTADCLTDKTLPLWGIFWSYGLIPVFIVGIVSVIIIFKSRHKLALIPFLLALPTFFYLFSPNISIDHPWMLRRFIFSIYPSLLFSAIIGIAIIQSFLTQKYFTYPLLKKRYYATLLLVILFLSGLPFALGYITFTENKGLLEQTKVLAGHFSSTDLVLVDRLATGDAWSMLPEPLNYFGVTNAVYFFNPEDFATLNRSGFSATYLIVSADEAPRYLASSAMRFTPVSTFTFDTERLAPSTENILPQKVRSTMKVMILKVE